MDELAARLGRVSHFRNLPPTALLDIVGSGRIRRFAAGATIFLEGEACAGMFVLLSGRVHMVKPGSGGQEQIVGVIEPVIMFNEVAVLDGGANPVTAVAARDSVAWAVGPAEFQRLIARYPILGTSLLRVLAARNRALIARCEDLSYRSVTERLAKLLLDLSHDGTLPVIRREHPIRQMAAQIGTAPELVSRSLSTISGAGLIGLTRTEIVVNDPAAMARLARLDSATACDPPASPAIH